MDYSSILFQFFMLKYTSYSWLHFMFSFTVLCLCCLNSRNFEGHCRFQKMFLPSILVGMHTPRSRGGRCLHSGRGIFPRTAARASPGGRDPHSCRGGTQQTQLLLHSLSSYLCIANAIICLWSKVGNRKQFTTEAN